MIYEDERPWNGIASIVGATWFEPYGRSLGLDPEQTAALRSFGRDFIEQAADGERSWLAAARFESRLVDLLLEMQPLGSRERFVFEAMASVNSSPLKLLDPLYEWVHALSALFDNGTPLQRPVGEIRALAKSRLSPDGFEGLLEAVSVEPGSGWDRQHRFGWDPKYRISAVEAWNGIQAPVVTFVFIRDAAPLPGWRELAARVEAGGINVVQEAPILPVDELLRVFSFERTWNEAPK